MLRRKLDGTFEFLAVEALLRSDPPTDWTSETKASVRARIFGALGEQSAPEPRIGLRPNERWIAVPAGLGIAAAIFFALNTLRTESTDQVPGTSSTQVVLSLSSLEPGKPFQAPRSTWLRTASGAALGLEPGTTIRLQGDEALRLETGRVTVATVGSVLSLVGIDWLAEVSPDSVAVVEGDLQRHSISVLNGGVRVVSAGEVHSLAPGDPPLLLYAPGIAGRPPVNPLVFEDPGAPQDGPPPAGAPPEVSSPASASTEPASPGDLPGLDPWAPEGSGTFTDNPSRSLEDLAGPDSPPAADSGPDPMPHPFSPQFDG